jgi:alpha-L-fucosidase
MPVDVVTDNANVEQKLKFMNNSLVIRNSLAALAAICITASVVAGQPAWPVDPKVVDAVKAIEIEANRGPFQPNWESLEKYQVPKWYLDAKFGVFIHWGLYSVPACSNEWYPRMMYQTNTGEFRHHAETWDPQNKFGYKDFVPMFKAENFDVKDWAELFKDAGDKYVVPVAEHHDGFPMYDCSYPQNPGTGLGASTGFGELA